MKKVKLERRPVIKITSDLVSFISMLLDAAILIVLIAWMALEISGAIR
jgi:hypothetical protein